MKPTFVLIKLPGGVAHAVNTQDLKVVSLDGQHAEIATSAATVKFLCTDYLAGRIKSELKSRYNVVELSSTGFRLQNNGHNHAILVVKDRHGSAVLVWPKALKAISVAENKLLVHAIGLKQPVEVSCAVPPGVLELDCHAALGSLRA